MKAVLLKEKSSVSVDNVRRPRPGSGDVLVKMRACGLCGSDLEKISGAYGMSSIRLGHEPAGEISYVGEEVDGFSTGDRVFVHHHVTVTPVLIVFMGITPCVECIKKVISILVDYLKNSWFRDGTLAAVGLFDCQIL